MFHHINHQVYDLQAEINELINELYLYLQEDDWHKLRQFDYRIQLITWTTTIAIRFFRKKQAAIMKNEYIDNLLHAQRAECIEEWLHHSLEAENLINKLHNKRYHFVLRKLILEDIEPQKLADTMKITVDNLYNIKQRALQKLIRIVGNE